MSTPPIFKQSAKLYLLGYMFANFKRLLHRALLTTLVTITLWGAYGNAMSTPKEYFERYNQWRARSNQKRQQEIRQQKNLAEQKRSMQQRQRELLARYKKLNQLSQQKHETQLADQKIANKIQPANNPQAQKQALSGLKAQHQAAMQSHAENVKLLKSKKPLTSSALSQMETNVGKREQVYQQQEQAKRFQDLQKKRATGQKVSGAGKNIMKVSDKVRKVGDELTYSGSAIASASGYALSAGAAAGRFTGRAINWAGKRVKRSADEKVQNSWDDDSLLKARIDRRSQKLEQIEQQRQNAKNSAGAFRTVRDKVTDTLGLTYKPKRLEQIDQKYDERRNTAQEKLKRLQGKLGDQSQQYTAYDRDKLSYLAQEQERLKREQQQRIIKQKTGVASKIRDKLGGSNDDRVQAINHKYDKQLEKNQLEIARLTALRNNNPLPKSTPAKEVTPAPVTAAKPKESENRWKRWGKKIESIGEQFDNANPNDQHRKSKVRKAAEVGYAIPGGFAVMGGVSIAGKAIGRNMQRLGNAKEASQQKKQAPLTVKEAQQLLLQQHDEKIGQLEANRQSALQKVKEKPKTFSEKLADITSTDTVKKRQEKINRKYDDLISAEHVEREKIASLSKENQHKAEQSDRQKIEAARLAQKNDPAISKENDVGYKLKDNRHLEELKLTDAQLIDKYQGKSNKLDLEILMNEKKLMQLQNQRDQKVSPQSLREKLDMMVPGHKEALHQKYSQPIVEMEQKLNSLKAQKKDYDLIAQSPEGKVNREFLEKKLNREAQMEKVVNPDIPQEKFSQETEKAQTVQKIGKAIHGAGDLVMMGGQMASLTGLPFVGSAGLVVKHLGGNAVKGLGKIVENKGLAQQHRVAQKEDPLRAHQAIEKEMISLQAERKKLEKQRVQAMTTSFGDIGQYTPIQTYADKVAARKQVEQKLKDLDGKMDDLAQLRRQTQIAE